MFPGSHATVYTNEAGEPIGWSDESSYEPDPFDDWDDAQRPDEEDDDVEVCRRCFDPLDEGEDYDGMCELCANAEEEEG